MDRPTKSKGNGAVDELTTEVGAEDEFDLNNVNMRPRHQHQAPPRIPTANASSSSTTKHEATHSAMDANSPGARLLQHVVPPVKKGPGTELQRAVRELADLDLNRFAHKPMLRAAVETTVQVLLGASQNWHNEVPEPEDIRKVTKLRIALQESDLGQVQSELAEFGVEVPDDVHEDPSEYEDEDDLEEQPDVDASSSSDSSAAAAKPTIDVGTELKKGKAKKATKVAVGAGLGLVPVPGLSTGFSVVMAAKSINSTLNHINALKKLRAGTKNEALGAMVDYILGKKKTKAVTTGVGAVPGLGTMLTVARAGKGFFKFVQGKRGEHRAIVARELWVMGHRGDREAQAVIAELVGPEKLAAVLADNDDGPVLLANKMASS